jgi:hypothetical protein
MTLFALVAAHPFKPGENISLVSQAEDIEEASDCFFEILHTSHLCGLFIQDSATYNAPHRGQYLFTYRVSANGYRLNRLGAVPADSLHQARQLLNTLEKQGVVIASPEHCS